jgi:hypothetical protein
MKVRGLHRMFARSRSEKIGPNCMSGLRKYAKPSRNFNTFFEASITFTHFINSNLSSYYMDLRESKMRDCNFGLYMRQYDCLAGKAIRLEAPQSAECENTANWRS